MAATQFAPRLGDRGWLNGHKLGARPYGYSTFEYDLTPYINKKDDNVIAVKVDNSDQPNSHWYSGCGIYCHVWINKSKNIHISQWDSMSLLVPMESSRYNHADEVELFVNGKSRGIRKKLVYKAANEGKKYKNSTEYHVM